MTENRATALATVARMQEMQVGMSYETQFQTKAIVAALLDIADAIRETKVKN